MYIEQAAVSWTGAAASSQSHRLALHTGPAALSLDDIKENSAAAANTARSTEELQASKVRQKSWQIVMCIVLQGVQAFLQKILQQIARICKCGVKL